MTLIEPKCGPLGPDPTPKVGSIWGYSLDFTWISKLDQYFGYTNPFLDPKVSPQPNLHPQGGPSGSKIVLVLALRFKNWVGIIKKLDQIQVQANNLGKPPNLNPFLGFCQAGGSNLGSIRVMLALRLRISSHFAVSSCFGHIQSQ